MAEAVAESTSTAPTTTETTSASSSPASPATADSSPSTSTPSKESRPTSMREAFERMEAKSTPVASKETAATGPATSQGPIPLDVHTKALANARDKAVAEYRQRYGWAEKIPQRQLEQWGALASQLSTDPVAFVTTLIRDLEGDPIHGPAWKARSGATPVNGSKPAVSLDPDVQIVNEHGQVTGTTFSAERVKAIVEQAVAEAIGKEVQPLKAESAQRQAQYRQAEVERLGQEHKAAVHQQADTIMAELEEIVDGDKALFTDISNVWAQHPDWTAHRAALEVRKSKITPRLQGQATDAATAEMKRKAAGNTAGAVTTAIPKRPTNQRELAQWLRDRDKNVSA